MRTVPVTNAAKITFFETHIPVWQPKPGTIGLTPDQVAELQALTDEARDAYNAAHEARKAAQAATLRQKQAVIKMASFGGDLVKTIRAFAETTDDRSVYSEANIPAPRAGSPLGPAPTPTHLTTRVTNAGSVELRWIAESRGRINFSIERSTTRPGERPTGWSLIGTATGKTFVDDTLPTGLASADYRITAERPGGRSQPTQPVSVLFGTCTQTTGERALRAAA